MRLIACLLLVGSLGGTALAEDLAAIIRTVEAREAATVPLFVAYRFRDIEPARSFAATLAFDGRRGQWLARVREHDQVQAWDPASTVLLLRKPGGGRWEGARKAGAILPEEITPIDFGLRALSLLRHKNTRVVADVRLGARDCVLLENRDAVRPIRFWLEKRHGYFPVQVIHFRPEEDTWKRSEFSYTSGGTRFVPTSWIVVDRLVPYGDGGGWFPVHGRQINCMAPSGAGEYTADEASLRAAVEKDFELPGRRTVENEITGETERHGAPEPGRRWVLPLLGASCALLLFVWMLARRARP